MTAPEHPHPARVHLGDLQAVAADLIEQTRDHAEWIVALDRAARIEEHARRAVVQLVASAREAGATWTEIGDAFSVTRQAAQQRFGAQQP